MRFTKVEIPDLVEALQRQGFSYAGPGWQGWMKFTGELKLSASSHACELVVSPDLDEIPRIWLNDLPMKRRELRPHLSASGYLCYLALDSVMFDSLDPVGLRISVHLVSQPIELFSAVRQRRHAERRHSHFGIVAARSAATMPAGSSRAGPTVQLVDRSAGGNWPRRRF